MEGLKRDLLLIFVGWGLGFGGQLVVEFFKAKAERKKSRIRAVLDFNTALSFLRAHQIQGHRITALKDSYVRRLQIANDARNKEWFNTLKQQLGEEQKRYLDHLSKDSDKIVRVNECLQICLSLLLNDDTLISWSANNQLDFTGNIKADFSNCSTDEEVQIALQKFQQIELVEEARKLEDSTNEITEYLSEKYIGRLVDVSETPWYLRWVARRLLRYLPSKMVRSS